MKLKHSVMKRNINKQKLLILTAILKPGTGSHQTSSSSPFHAKPARRSRRFVSCVRRSGATANHNDARLVDAQ